MMANLSSLLLNFLPKSKPVYDFLLYPLVYCWDKDLKAGMVG
jgi:hypothetical protein